MRSRNKRLFWRVGEKLLFIGQQKIWESFDEIEIMLRNKLSFVKKSCVFPPNPITFQPTHEVLNGSLVPLINDQMGPLKDAQMFSAISPNNGVSTSEWSVCIRKRMFWAFDDAFWSRKGTAHTFYKLCAPRIYKCRYCMCWYGWLKTYQN